MFTTGTLPARPDCVATIVFREAAGKTEPTMTIECASIEDRDALLKMHVDFGTARTLDNLAVYLDEIV